MVNIRLIYITKFNPTVLWLLSIKAALYMSVFGVKKCGNIYSQLYGKMVIDYHLLNFIHIKCLHQNWRNNNFHVSPVKLYFL
jgi:hypothetical protein